MIRRGKYNAKRTVVDGVTFASKREAKRYGELRLLLLAGHIADLELQPRFPLVVAGQRVATYVADFRYRDKKTGKVTVEDCKGCRTPVYVLKRKLVKALYAVEILET